jgi:hypothetical protein
MAWAAPGEPRLAGNDSDGPARTAHTARLDAAVGLGRTYAAAAAAAAGPQSRARPSESGRAAGHGGAAPITESALAAPAARAGKRSGPVRLGQVAEGAGRLLDCELKLPAPAGRAAARGARSLSESQSLWVGSAGRLRVGCGGPRGANLHYLYVFLGCEQYVQV